MVQFAFVTLREGGCLAGERVSLQTASGQWRGYAIEAFADNEERERSRAEGDKSRATPNPGLRCVAMRVLADTAVEVSHAPKTATQTQLGVADPPRASG
jgi:hypothetical protein